MRVVMYYSNTDLRLEEMPTPKIGRGEILLRVESSGICGTDIMEWYRRHRVPLVLGHEVAGEIVALGQGVKDYKQGERIAASHHLPCNRCDYCLAGHETVCETLRRTNFDPGGFAEYLRLPAINVEKGIYLLPEELSYEEATFIEPLACVLRGQRIAGMKKGKSLLIIGSGISGLLHLKLARISGAKCIVTTDISDYRLDAARRFGADKALQAQEYTPDCFREINQGRLADLVIICAGAESAIIQALQSVERGGGVLFFAAANQGVTVPLAVNELFWRNEITLSSSYAATPAEHLQAVELIRRKRIEVDEMITHRLSLKDTGLGFKLVSEAKDCLKVIINPQK